MLDDHILPHDSHQGRCDPCFGCKVHSMLLLTAHFTPVWVAALLSADAVEASGLNINFRVKSAVFGHISIKECTFLNKSSGHVFA